MNRLLVGAALIAAALNPIAGAETSFAQERLPSAKCNSEGAQGFRGRRYSAELASTVQQLTGASVVRVVEVGQPRTMDFSPNRVNLEIDKDGMILDVRCG